MLRIGKLTDYAVLILSVLARQSEIQSANALAKQLHLTQTTVSKILKLLCDGQLVHSMRGTDGGYQLAKPASDIKVVEVLECMEGHLALTSCCHPDRSCEIHSYCLLQHNWKKINRNIHGLLASISLQDMQTPLVM